MYLNNTPRVELQGIKDESIVNLVPEAEQLPQHLPLIYLLAQRGPSEPFLAGPGDLTRVFGAESFNTRGRYYNHQSVLAEQVMGEGNSVMVKRLRPKDAVEAGIVICASIEQQNSGEFNPYARQVNQNTGAEEVVVDDNGLMVGQGAGSGSEDGVVIHYRAVPADYFFDGVDGEGRPIYDFTQSYTEDVATGSGGGGGGLPVNNVIWDLMPAVEFRDAVGRMSLNITSGDIDVILNGDTYVTIGSAIGIIQWLEGPGSSASQNDQILHVTNNLVASTPPPVGGGTPWYTAFNASRYLYVALFGVVGRNPMDYTVYLDYFGGSPGTNKWLSFDDVNYHVWDAVNTPAQYPMTGNANSTETWLGSRVVNVDPTTLNTGGGGGGSTQTLTFAPIIHLEASSFGEYGNNLGVRITADHVTSNSQSSPEAVDAYLDVGSVVYNVQLFERPSAGSNGFGLNTIGGDTTVSFSFKPGAYDPSTNIELPIDRVVTDYSDDGVSTRTSPTFGPLGKAILFQDNLTSILTQAYTAESANSISDWYTLDPWAAERDEGPYGIDFMDILTGTDMLTGQPYHSVQISTDSAVYSSENTGVEVPRFKSNNTVWLKSGWDGQWDGADWFVESDEKSKGPEEYGINALLCDLIVREMTRLSYAGDNDPLIDSAKYPFSVVYDSGFCMSAKAALMTWLGLRKDIHLTLSTFVAGEADLTPSEEASIGATLSTQARLIPESVIHGTGVVRVTLVGHSGQLINHPYTKRLPLTIELAKKRARYMGAGNGYMKPGLAYDNFPLNTISAMKNVSSPWMGKVVKTAVWNSGVNFVQQVDRHTLQFPALQTLYAVKNSVLTSEILMQIAVDVQKQAEIVWRRMVGNTDLSQDQFIERSNDTLLELVRGRYQDRVTIVPDTRFTPADEARGFSWVLDVAIYGNNMKTVGRVNVIMRRASSLTA